MPVADAARLGRNQAARPGKRPVGGGAPKSGTKTRQKAPARRRKIAFKILPASRAKRRIQLRDPVIRQQRDIIDFNEVFAGEGAHIFGILKTETICPRPIEHSHWKSNPSWHPAAGIIAGRGKNWTAFAASAMGSRPGQGIIHDRGTRKTQSNADDIGAAPHA